MEYSGYVTVLYIEMQTALTIYKKTVASFGNDGIPNYSKIHNQISLSNSVKFQRQRDPRCIVRHIKQSD